MKKLFILALIAIATGTSVFAGTSDSKASKAVTHFATTFSEAKNVSWNSNGRFEKVTFVLNNETVNAFYNEDGDLIGTSKKVAFDKLPKAALETITSQYTFPEYQILECIKFTDDKNETKYYTSFDTENATVVLEILKNGRVGVFSETEK